MFRSWPFAMLVLLVGGLATRLVWELRRPMPALAHPEGEGARPRAIWRTTLVLLLVGHLVGLLAPRLLSIWNRSGARLVLLEEAGVAIGLVALAAWAGIAWRHLRTPLGSVALDLCDSAFRVLLLASIASGVGVAALDRWGSWWAATTLTPYLASLARGRPDAALMTAMPFLVRLHVWTAFAAAAVFPWSHPVGRWASAFRRAASRAAHGLAPVRRAMQARLRRLNPAPWLWPDED